jgi:hypothetical protein
MEATHVNAIFEARLAQSAPSASTTIADGTHQRERFIFATP